MTKEKESYLHPGVTRLKAGMVFAGAALILFSGTLSMQGIGQIQTAILTKYNAMQYFAFLSVLASMGTSIMLPIGGKLSDLLGRKLILWIGGSLFLLGSIVASIAPSLAIFLFFRAMIPFGLGFIMVVPYAVMAGIFQGKGRNMAYGILSAMLAVGYFIGGTLGGYLADIQQSWLAVAYPGVLCFIGVLLINSQIVNQRREGKIYFDIPGIILLSIAVITMMYSTTYGAKAGWTSPVILITLTLFVISTIAFVMVEKKSKEPLIPIYLFKNPVVVGILFIALFTVFYQKPMAFYVPLMLQKVMGVSQAMSGTVFIARAITNIIFPSLIAAWLIKNLNTRIWKSMFLCGLTIAAGWLMVSFTTPQTSISIFFVTFALLGIAESFKASTIMPFIQSTVEQKDMGSASALLAFFGSIGGSIAACISGLVYNAVVPDPNNLPVLQSGLNILFMVTAGTGVIIMLLSIFFVRNVQRKAAEKKNETTASA